jgi:hypothetical protein
MSFQDKLKHRFPKDEEQKKERCDPTASMFMTKEECWEFEVAVNRNLKELRQRCLDEILGTDGTQVRR